MHVERIYTKWWAPVETPVIVSRDEKYVWGYVLGKGSDRRVDVTL